MKSKGTEHPSDAILLSAVDGELRCGLQSSVGMHLAKCAICRKRQSEFQRAAESFGSWRQGLPVPDWKGPAALLRARMEDQRGGSLRATPVPALKTWMRTWPVGSSKAAFATATATFAALILIWSSVSGNLTAAAPDPLRTPGMTLAMTDAEVCAQPAVTEHPDIPRELAERVFVRYGVRHPKPRSYEIDFLITPALGGARDVRNLWPQPYTRGVWNSRVKDVLEEHLRGLVCSGNLALETAQKELAGDWVEAYKKYFHRTSPKPEHTFFEKDQAWE